MGWWRWQGRGLPNPEDNLYETLHPNLVRPVQKNKTIDESVVSILMQQS